MKYQVIYADPPWQYDFSQSKARQIENQYPTMTTPEICSLEVPADSNAVLFLWATAPKLEDGLAVMKAWGFIYKSHAIWDKKQIGMGYWFRGRHELLLVGTKGKFSPPPQAHVIDSVIVSARQEHSKKPSYVRDKISEWYPDQSRVELFARPDRQLNLEGKNTFDGWDTWGNEVESDVELLKKKKKSKQC